MRVAIMAVLALGLGACATDTRELPAAFHPPTWSPADPGKGSGPETEAVLKVVDTFLLALGNGDHELQASVELADGMIAFSRFTEAGPGPIRRMTQGSLQPQPGHDPFVEMYWDADVQVRGPFAQVWAPYVLFNNGATVHCGIDAFQLVKLDGVWKIHGSLSTMEPSACDELGAKNAAGMRPRDGWKETPNQ